MTASSGLRARPDGSGGKPAETALSWAAVAAAAGAVFAWAACCVLPMSLALAGLGLGGLSLIAEQRTWITLAALAVIGVGWVLTWRRARACRVDSACAAPSRLGIGLLGAASILVLLALIWQPLVEPWALTLIRGARG
ncbi:MAG: MFS transporter permease [Phenylobacterium sp.]|uniref:MFS transporter permease n=1 Tax=Phenylobacterium sp. TaxID=1871053 RepID=UPI001A3B083E|nr:MFS transporter permease [Phenylobacterium sp.]MBL8772210.1 MFS transporter permease [Phenylobacterium sp.]